MHHSRQIGWQQILAIGNIEFTSRNWEDYIIGQLDDKLI